MHLIIRKLHALQFQKMFLCFQYNIFVCKNKCPLQQGQFLLYILYKISLPGAEAILTQGHNCNNLNKGPLDDVSDKI